MASATIPADSQESIGDAREQREEVRRERAEAARELDVARADDEAVAAALLAVTEWVNTQQADITDAQRRLAANRLEAEIAQLAIEEADAETAALNERISRLALAGYMNGGEDQGAVFFEATDLTEIVRQNSLLDQANGDTVELLERMRAVEEDRAIAEARAIDAIRVAEEIEADLQGELDELESQQGVQAELKAEMERRVAEWETTVGELEAADAELTQFIREEEAKIAAAAAAAAAASGGGSTAPRPGSASVSGFQWPVAGSVTSGFGYRVHPIFGTRRLHKGLDISGGTGTPIASAKAGTVVSAGWQNGYGNTVIVSHGSGVTTLYAHQTRVGVSAGQSVDRGTIIGWVGSTGNSTGPHLHFEVRINGSAVDPRPYLP